jgi:hypothetical protein
MDFSIHRHLVGLLGWGISPTQHDNEFTHTKFYERYHNELGNFFAVSSGRTDGRTCINIIICDFLVLVFETFLHMARRYEMNFIVLGFCPVLILIKVRVH